MPALKQAPASVGKSEDRRDRIKMDAVGTRRTGSPHLSGRISLFALVLFFSGTAALIYQVLWIRELSLVVGVEVYSISVAVSAFFAGLAAGGALLGRVADQWKRPLLLYGVLETGVAVTGI